MVTELVTKDFKNLTREERGKVIYKSFKIIRTPKGWRVPSQSYYGKSYLVKLTKDYPICECPDNEIGRNKCKHIYAVEFYIKQEIDEEGNIKTSGAALGTFENVTHAPDITSLLLIQNGVDVYNLSSDQRLYDALSFYTSFAKEDQSIWNPTLENSLVAFSKGNLAMFFGYSWDYFTIKALNPDLSFGVIASPQLDSESPKNFASYWAEGISSESKNKKETFLFMKFLSSKSTQEKLFTEETKVRPFGEIYSDVGLAERLKDNKDAYVFLSQAPNAYSSYFVADTYDNGLNEKLNNYLKDAVNFILSGG